MGYSIKVINFHVLKEKNVPWFEKVILFLMNKGRIISSMELYQILKEKKEAKGNYFILTVDDGHRSFYKFIYPIIEKYQVPISLFVSPKIVKTETNFWFQEIEGYDFNLLRNLMVETINIPFDDLKKFRLKSILKCLRFETINSLIENYQLEFKEKKKPRMNMNYSELEKVDSSEMVTIGAHTMNHPILANESDLDSADEIIESILQLEDLLGHKIVDFAFPFGCALLDYLPRDVKIVHENGIKLCYSTLFKKVNVRDSPLEIPRGEITPGKFGHELKIGLWRGWKWMENIKNGNLEINQRREFENIFSTANF